jgi:hypothetical protein
MLTIVSPLEEELAPVREALAASDPDISFRVLGVGREGAEPNVKDLLRTLRQQRANSELLLLGFAGGVDSSLSAGDLVLAGRYCHIRDMGDYLVRVPDGMTLEEHRRREMTELMARDPNLPGPHTRADLKSLQPDPGMWRQAREALAQEGLTAVERNSMTTRELVTNPNTKAELHRQYQVGTVNMEDYWVARLAAAAKVPFLSVRAVLDTAGQVLPRWVTGLSGRPGWAAMNILSRPWQAPSLFELARQKRLAEASLVRFALAFAGYRQGAAPSPPAAA